MFCAKCSKDVGAGGIVQDDGATLCFECDRVVTQEAMDRALSFDGEPIATNISDNKDRSRKAELMALRAYGQKKSPTIRQRKHAERAARSGADARGLGAGLAIFGAVDDDPYAFSAGLHIHQSGQLAGARAEAQVAARGPQRVSPVDPALLRLLAERGGELGRQPIRSQAAATRWLDTIRDARLDADGTIHGVLEFVQMTVRRRFDLTFDPTTGLWNVDIETK